MSVAISQHLPAVPLLPWQKRYIEDQSRFKLVVGAAQASGKSFTNSLESSLRAMEEGKLEILLSASDRQSVELMEKVKMHTRAWDVRFEDGYFGRTSIVEHRAIFPNGGRMIALPANPDTARGYSGNMLLDEFALHRDSKAIWSAGFTRVARGFKLRVASTFKGTNNKFYELAKDLGLHSGIAPEMQPVRVGEWSGHWVDVWMARAQGSPVDPDQLRRAIKDEDAWLQDFCNVPMEDGASYIPLELIVAAESAVASLTWDGRPRPGLCAGFDVARKRDGAVIAIGDDIEGVTTIRGMIWMLRMKFAEMRKIAEGVAAVVGASGGRFPVDATGIGAQLAEELQDKFPCVEPVNFGESVETGVRTEEGNMVKRPVKEMMAAEVKRRMEDRALRLPEDQRVRSAFQAIKRYVGPTGAIRLDAAHTATGHADEFWAVALMVAGLTGARNYTPLDAGMLVGRPAAAGLMGRVF